MSRLRRAGKAPGFTLVELMASMVVLALLLLLLTQSVSGLRNVITRTTNALGQFRQARIAFETMTRRIGQATLNSYDDVNPAVYGTTQTGIVSNSYVRASELRFISGDAGTLIGGGTYPASPYPTDAIFFQAPLGFSLSAQNASLGQLLNTCGYYIQWGSDQYLRPPFLPSTVPYRWRFRLMELIEPSENLSIYKYTSGPSSTNTLISQSWYYSAKSWFQGDVQSPTTAPVHVLAENVIFLALLPMVAPQNAQSPVGGDVDGTSTDIAPAYLYDTSPASPPPKSPPYSQNQLPPMVYLMMIAVDDPSFARYQSTIGTANPTGLYPTPMLTNASYLSRIGTSSNPGDVMKITNTLTANNISYRIFTATIPLSRN